MKNYNFYSGPAILPPQVMEQAKAAIDDFEGTGLSVLEISHRSKQFVKVMDEARAMVKEILGLQANREVLFMHGGGLSQFHMVPMNLLNPGETASYFDTGHWAHGAMEEAALFGHVYTACSSADKNYMYIPAHYTLAPGSKYLHVTSNNTIYGTQLHGSKIPYSSTAPLVCDMSSDIFSREMDFNRFDLIYAGAQKNTGAAGTTLVIVNKEILGTVTRPIPRMLNYQLHIEKESMLNTPAVFAVYTAYLTLKWIKEQGLQQIQERNQHKAQKLYAAIDSSGLFKGTVAKEDRSLMNICFKADTPETEEKFAAFATGYKVVGIKGHRTVGGLRASVYNAMPGDGVDALIAAMQDFERRF